MGRPMNESWATKFDRCVLCGSTRYPHHGHGRCSGCANNRGIYNVKPKNAEGDAVLIPRWQLQGVQLGTSYTLDGESVIDVKLTSGRILDGLPITMVETVLQ